MAVALSLDVFLGALRAAAKGSCRILQKATFVENIKLSLLDSQSLQNDLVNGISTKIECNLVTKNDLQELKDQIEKNADNFELLATVYDELTEKAASKEEITEIKSNS